MSLSNGYSRERIMADAIESVETYRRQLSREFPDDVERSRMAEEMIAAREEFMDAALDHPFLQVVLVNQLRRLRQLQDGDALVVDGGAVDMAALETEFDALLEAYVSKDEEAIRLRSASVKAHLLAANFSARTIQRMIEAQDELREPERAFQERHKQHFGALWSKTPAARRMLSVYEKVDALPTDANGDPLEAFSVRRKIRETAAPEQDKPLFPKGSNAEDTWFRWRRRALEQVEVELLNRCFGDGHGLTLAASVAPQPRLVAYQACRNELVETTLRLIAQVAIRRFDTGTIELQDLLQEANLKLVEICDSYRRDGGAQFHSYARTSIEKFLRGRRAFDKGVMGIPHEAAQTRADIKRFIGRTIDESGRKPDEERISEHAGVTVKRVRQLLRAPRKTFSLNEYVVDKEYASPAYAEMDMENPLDLGDEIRWVEWGSVFPAKDVTFEGEADAALLRDAVDYVLKSLSPRERETIRLRFGLNDVGTHTLDQVAAIFGVTRERVRQVEARGLLKLRQPLRSAHLEQFIDDNRPEYLKKAALPDGDAVAKSAADDAVSA